MYGFNLPCLARNLSSAATVLCSVFNSIRAKLNFEDEKVLNNCLALGLVLAETTQPPMFGFIDDVGKEISPVVSRSFSDPR